MKIIFSNQQTIDLDIDNSHLGSTYQKIYKHLSRVPIPFRPWDTPYYLENKTYPEVVDYLAMYANKVSINIDKSRCLSRDQEYFNYIHSIYEKNYDGNPDWLDFHEHIHFCESYFREPFPLFCVDYREKAGPLVKDVDQEWYSNIKTQIRAGDVYVQWSELGKSPYVYWKNKEPNNINRLCELAKPWLKLQPKIYVALEDFNRLKNLEHIEEFNTWWKQYHDQWTSYWKVSSWNIENMFGVSVFGKTTQVELLKQLLKNRVRPEKVLYQ
jgi:hypothetical protein